MRANYNKRTSQQSPPPTPLLGAAIAFHFSQAAVHGNTVGFCLSGLYVVIQADAAKDTAPSLEILEDQKGVLCGMGHHSGMMNQVLSLREFLVAVQSLVKMGLDFWL
uniref:Uncharacterized protein n=1 Tax=Salix viminalis TaxID=40686 RepID=A0A6N2M0A6_SALVM